MLTGTPVASIERLGGRTPRVRVKAASGGAREFDAVVLATHSDTALALLGGGATAEERELLGAIPYSKCAARAGRTRALGVGRRPLQRAGAPCSGRTLAWLCLQGSRLACGC